MPEFLIGLFIGMTLGVSLCAWAVWTVLDPKK